MLANKNYIRIPLFLVVFCALLFAVDASRVPAFASEQQFTIGLTVTSDVTPPTVPTTLTPVVFSSTQINLSWTASTDNVAVEGYVVRRNGGAISTTTLVSLSDTGLSASTQYAYTVEAFDASGNYSGQTAQVFATTSAPSGGGGGDVTPPSVLGFTPMNGATGVSSSTQLSMSFSELVSKVSGDLRIKRTSDNSIVETIPVSGAFPGFSGSATWAFTTTDSAAPIISGVVSTTTYTTATINFTTNENALATLSWGTTTAYGMGTASEISYTLAHTMGVGGLATNTLYYFRITTKDASNNVSAASTGVFTTQNPPPPPDTTPPANPSAFSATPSLTSIALSWVNPSDGDFQAVRVLRRTSGYPSNPTDGVMVYDGNSQSVVDAGLATGTAYFYTIFARDVALNYSSGSITSATTQTGIIIPPPSETCSDGIMNQDETGIDTGGVCASPPPPPPIGGSSNCSSIVIANCRIPAASSGSTVSAPNTSCIFGDTGSCSFVCNNGGWTSASNSCTTSSSPIIPPITSTSTGPFPNFPATGTPSAGILALTLGDFVFTQLGDIDEILVQRKGVVRTNAEKNLRVSIAYEKLPDVLKTIAITVTDPNQNNKEFSYLLSVNSRKTAFEGVIPKLFSVEGKYPFSINILDHEKKGIVRLLGTFDAYIPFKVPSIVPPAVAEAISQAIENIQAPVNSISPVAAPIGVVVGAGQAVLLATNVGSVYDVYLLLLKLLALITGLFRRKRHEPWGVVYDSITKRPLDPAYVVAQVRDNKHSSGEAITDLDGRYGFLLNPGEYVIVANKTHYKFPSDKLKGRARDEFYENLYFGDPFQVREGGAIIYNIPLDPIEFDWNEFAKNQDKVFQVYSRNANIRMWIFNIIFYVGLIFSTLTLIIGPSILNALIVLVYVSIIVFQFFWKVTHQITRVISKQTGRVLPFALIKVWLPGLNTVVKKLVADEHGKFYFLVPPGTYYVTIEEKLPDGTYQEVLHTKEMTLKKGVVEGDFLV
ncbi:MAG: Alpha amylase catalytic region [Parcubacteria group bacterium GW2011_GWA2_47_7]|nr:MAG: Alpha amylase catalytic region [Parcubacteria group bacterium GW2011_GWA2_47_7]